MRAQLLVLLALVLSCSKKVEPPRRTEPWLASPSQTAADSGLAPRSFDFASESVVRFSLPTRKSRPAGSVAVTSGKLQLHPRDLERSRCSIEVDLTKLSVDESSLPEGADLEGRSASEHAQLWLELGPEVPSDKREQFARARFELVSIENLSSTSLDFAPRAKSRVRATVIGTLLIHGFRAPVRAEVVLEPLAPTESGAPRLSIRSASPLVLPLGPHDIAARSASGIADPLAAARAAEWVGKSVRLELDLVAEAEPRAANPP
jgi:hypothetical protein